MFLQVASLPNEVVERIVENFDIIQCMNMRLISGAINFYVCRRMQRLKANIAREEGLKLLHETVNKAFFSTSLTNAHFGAAIHLISTANHILGQGASNNAVHAYPANQSPLLQMGNILVDQIASNNFGFPATRGELLIQFARFSGNVNTSGIDYYVINYLLSTYVVRPNSGASETSGSSP